jgi:uncharacterized protein (DUF433 family)
LPRVLFDILLNSAGAPDQALSVLESRISRRNTGCMDWSGCSLVEVVPGKVSGVPLLKGTRLPADTVLDNYDAGLSEPEIAEQFDVPVSAVEALLSYAESRRAHAGSV